MKQECLPIGMSGTTYDLSSLLTANWTADYAVAYKSGHFVTLGVRTIKYTGSGATIPINALPAKLRPPAVMEAYITDQTDKTIALLQVTSAGVIQLAQEGWAGWVKPNNTYSGTITYYVESLDQ